MKALMMAAGAAMLLAGCATTPAAEMETAAAAMDPSSPLSAPGYMAMAASSDMFEIESSRLALQRSRHPAVREFAQMMINDHTRTSGEMMAAARELDLAPPPPGMMPHHMEMLDRLRTAGPSEFDAAYKREQLMAHEEALTLHRNYAEQGDAPPFRALASRAVPVIQMHWDHARTLPDMMQMEQPYQPAPAERRSGERG